MHEPSISVLMPVHNGAATIGVALTDLIAGLGPSDEILVMDDGSEDDTVPIVRGIATTDARVRLITGARAGLVATFNLGLTEVAHRWVARADADDRYPATRLQRQRQGCRDGVVLVSGDYVVEGARGSLGLIPTALTPPFVLTSLLHPQRIAHPGVLFDRDAVASVGGYKSEDFPAEDLALWLRLAAAGDFVGVPAVTVHWRFHAGSVTHARQRAQRELTQRMLRSSFPLAQVAQVGPSAVRSEVESYVGTPSAGSRRLLLARDLRTLVARGIGSAAYHESLRALGQYPLQSASAAAMLGAERVRRKAERRRLTSH